jgi:hypothetical protein
MHTSQTARDCREGEVMREQTGFSTRRSAMGTASATRSASVGARISLIACLLLGICGIALVLHCSGCDTSVGQQAQGEQSKKLAEAIDRLCDRLDKLESKRTTGKTALPDDLREQIDELLQQLESRDKWPRDFTEADDLRQKVLGRINRLPASAREANRHKLAQVRWGLEAICLLHEVGNGPLGTADAVKRSSGHRRLAELLGEAPSDRFKELRADLLTVKERIEQAALRLYQCWAFEHMKTYLNDKHYYNAWLDWVGNQLSQFGKANNEDNQKYQNDEWAQTFRRFGPSFQEEFEQLIEIRLGAKVQVRTKNGVLDANDRIEIYNNASSWLWVPGLGWRRTGWKQGIIEEIAALMASEAMVHYLVPIAPGLLDLPLALLYRATWEKGWQQLSDHLHYQMRVLVRSTEVRKRSPLEVSSALGAQFDHSAGEPGITSRSYVSWSPLGFSSSVIPERPTLLTTSAEPVLSPGVQIFAEMLAYVAIDLFKDWFKDWYAKYREAKRLDELIQYLKQHCEKRYGKQTVEQIDAGGGGN